MSILWRLIFFSRCTSTHHKLALDGLRFLRGPQAELWANLFLSNHEQYLAGSKAPDNEFRDFKNHVLHVKDGFWGGALTSAREWYQKTVVALSQGDWPAAAYNAGVLSHYFTDPFQPFHTDQTEAEGAVHRAAEWSICKSYEELQAIIEHDLSGWPHAELPARHDWLEEIIRQGALTAHESYDVCIDHYDLSRGIKHPPSGLDQESKDRLARLIGLAVVGFARVLERAFEESAANPPDVAVSLHALIATLKVPVNWIRKKFTDLHERAVVEAIYLEVQDKGKVTEALPDDERQVRKQYAQEVLKVPVRQLDAEPARATGTQYGTGAPSRGTTTPVVSPASFQRTVVSKPQTSTVSRGPAMPLETCLMVPLASSVPPDFVADTAARAYLHQSEMSGHTQIEAPRPVMPAVGSEPAVAAVLNSPQPKVEPRLKAASTTDTPPRRVSKPPRHLANPEPALLAPTVPLVSTGSSLEGAEMPVDMFAPLPPMPRVAQRDAKLTPVPSRTVEPRPTPAASPVIRTPEAKISEPPKPATRDTRSYSAQPAEASAVPAPHVRLPDPPPKSEPQATPLEIANRLSGTGQSAAFDFRNFSGVSTPADVTPAPKPTTPARPNVVATKPVVVPAPAPQFAPKKPPAAAPQQAVAQTDVLTANAPSRRYYLELTSPVVEAPTIGPKTATRLEQVGVRTVADLLGGDAGSIAEQLGNRAAQQVVQDWQDQARLVCRVPNLRGHDAQFLVACQIRTAEQLKVSEPRDLLTKVERFLATTVGQRLLRGGKTPDLTEVTEWIVAARDARNL